MRAIVVFMSHVSYLILNESTLFYFDLSTPKTSNRGKIQTWTDQVASANKRFKVPAPDTATSSTAIRTDRTTSTSSAVVAHAAPTSKKNAKLEQGGVKSFSAFLDEDESAERDAALTSPIKGKKRLTTKVCCQVMI